MCNALPIIYLEENVRLLAAALPHMPAGWTALGGVAMEDAGLDGDEYLLLHPAFGIVVLDILPTVPTPPKAANKIREALAQDAGVARFGAVPDVKILGIHHLDIATMPRAIGALFGTNAPGPCPRNEEWAEAVRRTLNATRVEPRQADPAAPRPRAEGTRRFRNSRLAIIVTAGATLAAATLWYRGQIFPPSPFLGARIAGLNSLDNRIAASFPPLAGREEDGSVLPGTGLLSGETAAVAPPPASPLAAAGSSDDKPPSPSQQEGPGLPAPAVPSEAQFQASAPAAVLPTPEHRGVAERVEDHSEQVTRDTPMQSPDLAQSGGAAGPGDPQPAEAPATEADASRDAAATLSSRTGVTPAEPAPPQTAAGASPRIVEVRPPSPSVSILLRRGDEMMALGDFSSARRYYDRAAEHSGEAALALGKTYDPVFLAGVGGQRSQGDATLAAEWYRRAVTLGVQEAETRLLQLGLAPAE